MITIKTTKQPEVRVYTYDDLFDPVNRLSGKILKATQDNDKGAKVRLMVDGDYRHLIVMDNKTSLSPIHVFAKDNTAHWSHRYFVIDEGTTIILSNKCDTIILSNDECSE